MLVESSQEDYCSKIVVNKRIKKKIVFIVISDLSMNLYVRQNVFQK